MHIVKSINGSQVYNCFPMDGITRVDGQSIFFLFGQRSIMAFWASSGHADSFTTSLLSFDRHFWMSGTWDRSTALGPSACNGLLRNPDSPFGVCGLV